jgi:hypothetical protein
MSIYYIKMGNEIKKPFIISENYGGKNARQRPGNRAER